MQRLNFQAVCRIVGALMAAVVLAAFSAAADELVLKNGQKISGTIVGYESNMFRVETEYGFVLVRKDKVATINVNSGAPEKSDKPKEVSKPPTPKPVARSAEKAATPPAPTAPVVVVASPPASATPVPSAAPLPSPVAAPLPSPPPPPVVVSAPPPTRVPAAAPPPPPPVSHPVDDPPPATIREHLEGTNYVNDTFQFSFYRPSDWRIQEDVPRQTGSGIAAVGTEDEQNLLLVDRQLWSGPPDLKVDRGEAHLRKSYQEYQKLSESADELNGVAALRRTFRGVLDGVEWHGISVQVARGRTLFTIIGVTSAESFQFQQAVLNKMINSFRFLPPAAHPSGAP